jgi:KaiC/GvpD/RAD55 family RecA-like ATPase
MAAVPATETMLNAALWWASRGFSVFPVFELQSGKCACGPSKDCERNDSAGKHPRIGQWQILATAEEAKVREWWGRWPNANIGICCGRELEGGGFLLVVDVDPRHDGDMHLALLEQKYGELPTTARNLTGGGGQHIFFRSPRKVKSRSNALGPGVDVKCDRGYVLAPPSNHKSGGIYRRDAAFDVEDTPISEAPTWLPILADPPEVTTRETAKAADAFIEGGRHDAMVSLAGTIRRRGLSPAEMLPTLLAVNSARCRPPLDEHEVKKIAYSATWSVTEPLSGVRVRPTISPADRVRELAKLGPVMRLPTCLPTLDGDCRGGLPARRLVVFGGAPGAGKTSLATYLGWNWAKAGTPVAFLAVDEGPEGVLMRIAQLEGINPDRIEEREPEALDRLASLIAEVPMVLVDSEDASGSVEAIAMMLAAIPTTGPRVLIVDSLQTVRAAGTETAKDARERVDTVVRALQAAREKYGFLVIATCELSRGAYRSRSVAEAINDLAAFKESGGIEYAAQTALVLRSVPDEASLVDVTVPKNRAYKRNPFRLRMDHRTTSFAEIEAPAAEPTGSDGANRFARIRAKIMKACAQLSDLNSATKIATAVGGEKAFTLRVIKALIEDGDLAMVGRGYRPRPRGEEVEV